MLTDTGFTKLFQPGKKKVQNPETTIFKTKHLDLSETESIFEAWNY